MNDQFQNNLCPSNLSNERGSALWFILIAIVLIGLLTAVLGRSGSNVDQTGNVEQQRIKISQMLRYSKGVQGAAEQMKMRGVSESDMSFALDGTDNVNCTTTECRLFHVEGGGLSLQDPPSGIGAASWLYTGSNAVANVGTAAPDLLMILRSVPDSYCTQINTLLRFTPPSGDTDANFTAFNGTYTTSETFADTNGAQAACLSTATENFFYQVVLAR